MCWSQTFGIRQSHEWFLCCRLLHRSLEVDDTGMLTASLVVPKEVLVLGKDDTILAQGERQSLVVRGANEVGIGRCGDIHPPQAKCLRHCMVYILIKMKSYHCPSPWRLVSVRAGSLHSSP